ncbi:hypothetical protein [Oenococcus kitaharae]|uniref:Uncharacterized protein n=1 Tax=Oenococcus kitaharae DSM 17330 TaxID=1045004 RepID=G9WJU9_9LACO|nr:hypothetical protein [Oenococcus kitaharae]EHN58129.1 hypothetical protein OKIT_1884 [Oenococcus kitaharae DSM 17330]OEY82414.1 hypothetical protein NV75_08390 [Oenococcus kitaharae]OEY82548.1 hypothetical protein NT95_06150 [Oenococcus kitaharae]OEY84199.1 hypothetical protein NT96_05295 [Oenococcus kitaharae]
MKKENVCFVLALIVGFAGLALFHGLVSNISIGIAAVLILLSLIFESVRKVKNVAQLIHHREQK